MDDEALKEAREALEKWIEAKDYSDMSLDQLFKERFEILQRMFLTTKTLLEDTVNYQLVTVHMGQKMVSNLADAVKIEE